MLTTALMALLILVVLAVAAIAHHHGEPTADELDPEAVARNVRRHQERRAEEIRQAEASARLEDAVRANRAHAGRVYLTTRR